MLSILIPVYNFDVTALVKELLSQVLAENIDYEIILMDDCSEEKFKLINQTCKKLNNIEYIELPVNVGRAKIRNKLANTAKHSCLLFLDCDSMICDRSYVKKYLNSINDYCVICGGREYLQAKPTDINLYFRWLYGVKRESHNAESRNLNSNNSFMTNNFIISKEIFNELKFEENITLYGHEDTLFGLELKNRNIIISHIDNPVIHIGLETADEFIKKTKEGIENLYKIFTLYKDKKQLINSVKLLKYAEFANKFYLRKLIKSIFIIFENLILDNLRGKRPSLPVFDFYKLGYLCFKGKITSRTK